VETVNPEDQFARNASQYDRFYTLYPGTMESPSLCGTIGSDGRRQGCEPLAALEGLYLLTASVPKLDQSGSQSDYVRLDGGVSRVHCALCYNLLSSNWFGR
jgi:hypothetical protein